MSSPDSPAPDAQPPVAHPPGDGAALPGVLADAARALAAAPADADDAVLLAIVGEAIVPALGDVVTLYAGDGRPIGVAPVDVPLGLAAEIVAPLGDAMTDGLLAIGSSDATRIYTDAERSAADVIAALLGARGETAGYARGDAPSAARGAGAGGPRADPRAEQRLDDAGRRGRAADGPERLLAGPPGDVAGGLEGPGRARTARPGVPLADAHPGRATRLAVAGTFFHLPLATDAERRLGTHLQPLGID